MIIAVLSFFLSLLSLFVLWPLSIVGGALGFVALDLAGDDDDVQRGFAIAGIVVGIISIILVAVSYSLK